MGAAAMLLGGVHFKTARFWRIEADDVSWYLSNKSFDMYGLYAYGTPDGTGSAFSIPMAIGSSVYLSGSYKADNALPTVGGFWSQSQPTNFPLFWSVKLPAASVVRSIVLSVGSGSGMVSCPRKIIIQGSSDGMTWENIITKDVPSAADSNPETVILTNVQPADSGSSYQYYRLLALNSSDYWSWNRSAAIGDFHWDMYEVLFYESTDGSGSNVAMSKAAAPASYGAPYEGLKAIDGSNSSFLAMDNSLFSNNYLRFDLGSAKVLRSVKLDIRSSGANGLYFPKSVWVSCSDREDDTAWERLKRFDIANSTSDHAIRLLDYIQ